MVTMGREDSTENCRVSRNHIKRLDPMEPVDPKMAIRFMGCSFVIWSYTPSGPPGPKMGVSSIYPALPPSFGRYSAGALYFDRPIYQLISCNQ